MFALGQVLTRMRMLWSSAESRNEERPQPSARKVLFTAGVLQIVLIGILQVFVRRERKSEPNGYFQDEEGVQIHSSDFKLAAI